MARLKSEILKHLSKRLDLSESSIRQYISHIRTEHPKATINAAAQIFALQNKTTVLRMLSQEDRNTLPTNIEIEKEKTILKTKNRGVRKEKPFIEYQTNEYFKKGHINELSKAYSKGCNTAVFILARKIIENLIIDILKKKYPENNKDNKDLYFDTSQKRFKDFGIILENLKNKKNDFGTETKAIDRLYSLAIPFKNDANDKTHSWYHLVETRKEIDNLSLPAIIEIIKNIEKIVGIR